MSREYPDRPIFGVGAIVFKADYVLLIKRSRPPRDGLWSLPGGVQKLGETIHEALIREVKEETGLLVTVDRLATLIDIIDTDNAGRTRHHYTVADYVCCAAGGVLKPGGDAADAKWVKVGDLGKYDLTPKTKEVIETVWKQSKNI